MAPKRVLRVAIVGGGISALGRVLHNGELTMRLAGGIAQAVRLIEALGDKVVLTVSP